MIGGSHPSAVRSPVAALNLLLRSTGLKMFFILTLALLPLGIIALAASLQAIRTADLEKEALLRVAVAQSARKLTADIHSDRTAMQLTVDALAAGTADPRMCDRLAFFLRYDDPHGGSFAIYDRAGRKLCGSGAAELTGVAPGNRFSPGAAELLPASGYLVVRVRSADDRVVGLAFYSRQQLESVADPATALQNRQLALEQGSRRLLVSRPPGSVSGNLSSLTARVEPLDMILRMSVRDPPATLARRLTLVLPLVMWFAAAAIGWLVVNRLLIRPLVQLRRAVAAYQPGEVLEPLHRIRTPALEISALGETFRAISDDVATHEAEMAEGLARQTKLTREVHHRVKNNLQIIASLISLHARAAHEPEAVAAYASIQRRVDALSVVHRNHFAELEENRGVGVRSLISELSASLRGTAPAEARRFGIQIDSDNLYITQDVAVPVAFLVTELVELAMLSDPRASMRISVRQEPDDPRRALLSVTSRALRETAIDGAHLHDRFDRVLTGLSRQLRAPLDHDGATGDYSIGISVVV
jgi:two-component sensor histidine kinase